MPAVTAGVLFTKKQTLMFALCIILIFYTTKKVDVLFQQKATLVKSMEYSNIYYKYFSLKTVFQHNFLDTGVNNFT